MRKSLAVLLGLILMMMAVRPATAAPTAATAFGVVLDQAGRPVSGAEVEFYQLGAGLVGTLTTGPDGAFRLAAQTPGASQAPLWQLRVWAKGYRTKESGWVNLSQAPYQPLQLESINGGLQVTVRDQQGLPPAAGYVTLATGAGQLQAQAQLANGQFAQQELPAGEYRVMVSVPGYGAVTRSLTVSPDRVASAVIDLEKAGFTVTGELRDAVTNAPLAGAAVELQRQDQTHVITAVTDGSGRFRLAAPDEAPGTYRLWLTAEGYRPGLSEPLTAVRGQNLDLSGGSALTLAPATGTVAATLIDRWGVPRPGSQVVLLLQGYGEVASATTAAGGEARFEQVPAGAGYHYALLTPDSDDALPSVWFELPAGTTTQRLLQGAPGSAETVGISSISGVVTTPSGSPVPGAAVEVLRHGEVITTVATDGSGAFLVRDIRATRDERRNMDPYMLRFSKDGYVSAREFTMSGQSVTDLPLTNGVRTILQAVLRPVAPDLRGRLTAADGAPVAGGTVHLRAADGADQWTASADENGWYTFKAAGIRPGVRYAVNAEAKGYLPAGWADVTDSALRGESLPTLRLPATGAAVTGQVLGPAGGTEAGVSVTLLGPAGELLAEAKTDDAGYYRIAANLPRTGMLTLTAARTGWSRAVAELAERPAPGAGISRDLVIFPETAALEGRAMAADGTPAGGVWVELLAEGKGVIDSARADATGYFRFQQIALNRSGWFSLRVRTGSGVTFSGSLTHRTELVPMLRLAPGERTVTDLLVTKP